MMERKRKNKYIDLKETIHKKLSIQFSLDGFSFCVFDEYLQEFVSFKEYPFAEKAKTPDELLDSIKQVFVKEPQLRLKYAKVEVIHENNLSSFVPKALFNEANIEDYISFNNKTFYNDFFTYDEIANQEMNAVFIPYININNFLIDQYGSFIYKHSSSILVEKLLNYFASKTGISFFVNVAKSHFEITVSNNKKLLFFNTFNYATKEDFIYYILFVIEQLKLDPELVDLQFLGEINKESELYQIVYKYVKNVSYIKENFTFNTDSTIDNLIIRAHFTLFHFN